MTRGFKYNRKRILNIPPYIRKIALKWAYIFKHILHKAGVVFDKINLHYPPNDVGATGTFIFVSSLGDGEFRHSELCRYPHLLYYIRQGTNSRTSGFFLGYTNHNLN